MFKPVDHAVNGDNLVAVFISPLEDVPESFRTEGVSGIWIAMPDRIDAGFAVSADAARCAEASGRLLVVEVGDGSNRETWVPLAPALDA